MNDDTENTMEDSSENETTTMYEARMNDNTEKTMEDISKEKGDINETTTMYDKHVMDQQLGMIPSDDVLFVDVGSFSLSTGVVRRALAKHLGGNWPHFTVATLSGQGELQHDHTPSWGGQGEGGEQREIEDYQTPTWGGRDQSQDSNQQVEEQNENMIFLEKIGCEILFHFQLGNDVRISNRLFSKVILTFPNQMESRTEDLLWGSRALLEDGGELVMVGTHPNMPGTGLVMFSHVNTNDVNCQEDQRMSR